MKKKSKEIFIKYGGQLRMNEAIKLGISRYMLYKLRDKGVIEQISRGVYRLKELPPISNPDLVTVSLRFPNSIICLVSALAFHNITTQIPHSVSVAVCRSSRLPSLEYPPIQSHRFSNDAFNAGVENHRIDEVPVKIYNMEKTLADCFKFRNKVGMDVVLEALKLYKARKNFNLDKLIKYAKICRIKNVMLPYLETII
ncbi:MAG: type IV toxin-antitoxin system AbiEi family antitoxin domain-containing protein [Deltaproteobacteria bacterium]|uniref:type IV toxin-antitoxin system AbiEi family antitoxin domain-containing protein n=1 Tax=Desulfobacula sp. TaxID=2593537 RepID=UPI0019C0EA2E|nr:type IV toxin-antitoxin system AbiEi family antitoxin domain-containing protein [Candidatus Desulfobacula maris]MBL6996297.1 type IV toxin-antitoxin system AbiEi family antitoxin domain-containing protein [Desulfobacula sp.]